VNGSSIQQASRAIRRAGGWLLSAWLLCSAAPARAAVLDWNSLSWTAGALSMTYYATNNVNASGLFYYDSTFPTNNTSTPASVTVSISGDTGFMNGGFPAVTNDISGGYSSPTNNALQFWVNHFTSPTQQLVIDVAFNYYAGVSNLTAILLDVDQSVNSQVIQNGHGHNATFTTNYGYNDEVRDIGAHYANTNVGSVNITPVSGATYVVAGTGTNATVTGDANNPNTLGGGNVTLDFGTNSVADFTFTYGNGANTFATPEQQAISLYQISFSPRRAPEFKPGVAAIVVCVLTVFLRRRRIQASPDA
jgi:hypothetical protein